MGKRCPRIQQKMSHMTTKSVESIDSTVTFRWWYMYLMNVVHVHVCLLDNFYHASIAVEYLTWTGYSFIQIEYPCAPCQAIRNNELKFKDFCRRGGFCWKSPLPRINKFQSKAYIQTCMNLCTSLKIPNSNR